MMEFNSQPERVRTEAAGGTNASAMPAAAPSMRGWAAVSIVLLCISCGIPVVGILIGAFSRFEYGSRERLGFGIFWKVVPLLAGGLAWALLVGCVLLLVMRLSTSPARPVGRAWVWSPIATFLALAALHVFYWRYLAYFAHHDDYWVVGIWAGLALITVGLVMQTVRLVVRSRKNEARRRDLRLLFSIALSETVAFLVVNGMATFLLWYAIASVLSDHD